MARKAKKPKDPLAKFGHFLMTNLRDPCIEHYDYMAKGHWKAPALQSLQNDLRKLSEKERAMVRKCVIEGLNAAIHDFLFKLQEIADFDNDIQVHVDGQNIVELSDGLHGELFSSEGWMAKYSAYGAPPEEE